MYNTRTLSKGNIMSTRKQKCLSCNKTLQRDTKDFTLQKEPYKGNQLCYMKKKEVMTCSIPTSNINVGDVVYSYRVWDGESYKLFYGKKFCGRHCAAMYAVRRLS